jgi:hypothetical protein
VKVAGVHVPESINGSHQIHSNNLPGWLQESRGEPVWVLRFIRREHMYNLEDFLFYEMLDQAGQVEL